MSGGEGRRCPLCGADWAAGRGTGSCKACTSRAREPGAVDDWPAYLRERAPELEVSGSATEPVVEGLRLTLGPLPAESAEAILEALREVAPILRRGPRKGEGAARRPGPIARLLGAPKESWAARRLLALGLAPEPGTGPGDTEKVETYTGPAGRALLSDEGLSLTYTTFVWRRSHAMDEVDRVYLALPADALPALEADAEAVIGRLLRLRYAVAAKVRYRCERCAGRFDALAFHAYLGACHGCAERELGVIH